MKCFGILLKQFEMREWLSGRALPCQGKCREFESRMGHQRCVHAGVAELADALDLGSSV